MSPKKQRVEPHSSLLTLPLEVSAEIFSFAMTGNAAAALRCAANLAVAHPKLSEALSLPGPQQRTYQRLLTQRRIVQDLWARTPEHLRMATCAPLWDVLPCSARSTLFASAIDWLRQSAEQRDNQANLHGKVTCAPYINFLLQRCNQLVPTDVALLMVAGAATVEEIIIEEAMDGTWFRQLKPALREQVVKQAESALPVARYLAKIDHTAFTSQEFNRIIAAVLMSNTIDQQVLPDFFFSESAIDLDKKNLARLIDLAMSEMRQEDFEGAAVLSLLSLGQDLTAHDTDRLCRLFIDQFCESNDRSYVMDILAIYYETYSMEVRLRIIPMILGCLYDDDDAIAAFHFIEVAWRELNMQQREQVAIFIEAQTEMLSRCIDPQQLNFMEAEDDPLRLKIAVHQLRVACREALRQQKEHRRHSTCIALQNFIDAPDDLPLLVRGELRDVGHLPTDLIEQAIKKIVRYSMLMIHEGAVARKQLKILIDALAPHQVVGAFEILRSQHPSCARTLGLMRLTRHRATLSTAQLAQLSQYVLSSLPSDWNTCIMGALNLLREQKRLSSGVRGELALWSVDTMTRHCPWLLPELAEIVAHESYL